MSENRKVPKIRFKGFTDDWEQRKLESLIIKGGSGGTPTSTNRSYYDGPIPFLGISDITNSNGFIYKTEKSITKLGLNNSSAWIVPSEAISIAMYASVGKIAILKVDAATSQAFYNMIFDDFTFRDFVFHRLNYANIKKEWEPLISTGTQSNLNAEKVKNFEFKISKDMDEISKINKIFNEVDNLITLHQSKLDKLQNIKKSLLDKMFPKNDAKIPEIRFKGFTDDWEQRKAKDLCSITTGKSNTQDQVQDGKYPFYIRSDVPVRSNRYLYDEEAVITIGDGNIGRVFHYVNGKFDLHQRCYKMADFKALTAKYFYYYFSTKFYERAMSMTAKATVDSVRLEMISDMEIKFPKSTTEQTNISELLTNLDNLITLHQSKLDKLQNIKKSLLEKMFV